MTHDSRISWVARRSLLAVGLLLALLQLPVYRVSAAEPLLRVGQTGSLLGVEGRLAAAVERSIAWEVLTDYDRFPEFVPGMQSSQVLEVRASEKTIAQRGEIIANGPRLRYEGMLRVEERPDEGVRLSFLSGPFRGSEGEWQLSGKRPVILSYHLRLDLTKSPLPPPMAATITEQQVRTWLTALVREMERRQANRK